MPCHAWWNTTKQTAVAFYLYLIHNQCVKSRIQIVLHSHSVLHFTLSFINVYFAVGFLQYKAKIGVVCQRRLFSRNECENIKNMNFWLPHSAFGKYYCLLGTCKRWLRMMTWWLLILFSFLSGECRACFENNKNGEEFCSTLLSSYSSYVPFVCLLKFDWSQWMNEKCFVCDRVVADEDPKSIGCHVRHMPDNYMYESGHGLSLGWSVSRQLERWDEGDQSKLILHLRLSFCCCDFFYE